MSLRYALLIIVVVCLNSFVTFSGTLVGQWIPIFKGVDYSVSSNTPPGDFPHRQVVTAFRVDLTDPDIHFLTTPRRDDYIAGVQEVGGLTVSGFLQTYHLQAVINANFFDEGFYYRPAGWPMDIYGLSISEGVTVSPQDGAAHSAALLFTTNNEASIIYTNWPPHDTTGIFTAVAGNYPLVVNGQNIAPRNGRLETDPRTAFGLSEDRRYLYLMGIDGRQSGYSDGAYDYETAGWLLLLGAYDGVNMDGGGSTTLVMASSTGSPIRLNRSNAVADSGNERTIGSHFGIYAKPLPAFIKDVTAVPDDTSATIKWSTVEPAGSLVEYGSTEDLGTFSTEITLLETNHSVELFGLTPKTSYFYRITSSTPSTTNVSGLFVFTTTNYVTTNFVMDITNEWKFASSVESSDWTLPDYDDSDWNGPGPGLLWVDVRTTGPNELVEPKNTQMDADPATGYPYITYYFRAHFNLSNLVAGSTLSLSGYIDDGAILSLNGKEIWRLRMPAVVDATTLAPEYGCDGDATCLDEYVVPSSDLDGLREGDNVLAAEVHNYRPNSADITFGLAVSLIEPLSRSAPSIAIDYQGSVITLRWDAAGYRLQSSDSVQRGWIDEALTSPAAIEPAASRRFYRLRR